MEINEKKYNLKSCTKLPLPSAELKELIDKAKDWAVMHGFGMRPKTNFTKDSIQIAPFTLLPSPFPRSEYENALNIQTTLNLLVHKVAHDFEFLKSTLAMTVQVDEFTRRLFDIYETVYNEGLTQNISLGLLRSDYMLNSHCCTDNDNYKIEKPFCCLKQVEINTIASGMAWLGSIMPKCHQFILNELELKNFNNHLPENSALEIICGGILEAWKIYNNSSAIILFIVEDFSLNICDQRYHEYEIHRQNPDVKVIRKTLTQLSTEANLGPNKELIVNDKIVAVVYFRYGYAPDNYPGENEWHVRLLIERSLAIKSPSIQYHLAGTKKVQQALAIPGVVKRYLENEETVERVTKIFTALPDVIHAVAKYEVRSEPREMYFFREGTVVMWNIEEIECENILQFIKNYEEDSYSSVLIQEECEIMSYTHSEGGKRSHLKEGNVYLATNASPLDKYTFSNAISQSVKLGIWEASLDHYIESIEFITEDLKTGRKIKMSRREVLRKQGELFALRHLINLSSDLLDTPDFYWERDNLESLYQQICGYLSITKRTRVMNEKINHCVELVELLSSHLSDRHHVRLEWMIIILILVEVCFELVHYLDRYLEKQQETIEYQSEPRIL